jgi:hypothetical protein
MDLLTGNFALRSPEVQRGGLDVELSREVFDREQHGFPNRGSLTTPPPPCLRSRPYASVSCGGWALRESIGRVLPKPSGLADAMRAAQHLGFAPVPLGYGGQGLLVRSVRLRRPYLNRFPVVAGLLQQSMMLGLPALLAGFRDTLQTLVSIGLFQDHG